MKISRWIHAERKHVASSLEAACLWRCWQRSQSSADNALIRFWTRSCRFLRIVIDPLSDTRVVTGCDVWSIQTLHSKLRDLLAESKRYSQLFSVQLKLLIQSYDEQRQYFESISQTNRPTVLFNCYRVTPLTVQYKADQQAPRVYVGVTTLQYDCEQQWERRLINWRNCPPHTQRWKMAGQKPRFLDLKNLKNFKSPSFCF